MTNIESTTTSSHNETSSSLTDKLKEMVGMSITARPARSLSVEDELVLFIQAVQAFKGAFSSFWLQFRGRFGRLYRIALRVNIIPATSVASESIFSIAGYITRKQRSSLSSKSLRQLMVLKESHKLDVLREISRSESHSWVPCQCGCLGFFRKRNKRIKSLFCYDCLHLAYEYRHTSGAALSYFITSHFLTNRSEEEACTDRKSVV